ncbi:C4-dicarboxylate transporter DctM subunit [Tepidamorphus gemmatus]|uniref:TRAP transporter large permease protein n=1 Tax=Tepidamorphus gemmatus TaxID=747076 RepID=A0A4R3MDR5_9HYPH|nr:TRAP transporter large permease [Tepidamorphus gemmatus]TCT11586.1 C4-dicarboxylate transporter DctM subunit [Tepidamorphus gemmatus]
MLLTICIILLFVFVLLGMDIAFAIGVAALAFIAASQFDARPVNPVLFVRTVTSGVDSFAMLAIPMYVFVGELMTSAGVTRRLIDFAASLVAHRPGGLANVGITSNLFMAGISGSAVADAAATGSILVPEMKKRGYSARYAAGVISAAAAMGPIIPPSILFILLASIANLSVGDLFIAGILPGLLMYVGLIAMSGYLARRNGIPMEPKASPDARRMAIRAGILPLGAPLIIIASKVFGIATPTESAAIVVLYTIVIGTLVYRDLTLRGFLDAAIAAAMTTAVIMMTVAFSQIFGQIAVLAGLGRMVQATLLGISDNPYVLFFVINLMLLVLGTFLDALPLMLILSPILFPLMTGLGVDPIHFGLVMVFNLVLGMITPPVGLNLFVMSRISGVGILSVFRGGLPFYMVLWVTLIILTYVPWFSTFLPHLLRK